ncbi:MAG TPA: S9 family peptidase [Vicinamibacteria bacterium]|nr:S9 family peptidase [Vicinamibacteria bacterium]
MSFLSFAALVLALSPLAAAEKRSVSFEDLLSVRAVSEPAISPDGATVLFTAASWVEGEADDAEMEWVSHVYRIPVLGGEPAQLTYGEKGESSPAWSPDGLWMSFLAARDPRAPDQEPKRQIWLMRASGGEALRLTDAEEGVEGYEWAPDSSAIAFTTRDALPKEEAQKRKRRDDPVVFEGDARMTHLWTIDLESREARQRTRGTAYTVRGGPSYSPDGTRIAFTAAPTPWLRDGRDDVYVVTLADDETERLTTNLGQDEAPAFSPDGKLIAFLTTPNDAVPLPDGTQISDLRNARLALYDLSSKKVTDLSDAAFDLIPGEPRWSPGGERLLFSVGDRSYLEIYSFDVRKRRYRKLTEGANATLGGLSKDGSVAAFTSESASSPAEVYVSGPHFEAPRRLTTMNPQAEALALGATEVVTWKSTEGHEIEGVLVKPVGYEPGKRYPLLTVVHGGPTGAHFNTFRVRYGDGGQHWAGQGWAVLYPNPRGSTNYGEAFMRANLADWGGGDYRDIMAGVDAMVARGIADPEKLAIQGWSYGGYMTCWTVSQTTRFKAAMIGAGLTNLVSMYGTNDVPNYLGAFFNGTLSSETEHLYRERSGLTYASQVTTPTLILHGSADERVPIGQPMEFHRALKDRGVATELVFYPREGHGLKEYYHRLDRLRRQYEWISRHTLSPAAGAAPTSN